MKSFIIYIFLVIAQLLSIHAQAQENNAVLCSDGIDNDGDGLADCDDSECIALPNQGCNTCLLDGLSFGDEIVANGVNCLAENENFDPDQALGVANYNGIPADGKYVSLGMQGFIEIAFTNNILVNSGDDAADLWVFEIGPAVESMSIDLRPFDQITIDRLESTGIDGDNDGFYQMGEISGSTSGLDIDDRIAGFVFADLRFDAVRVTDVNGNCGDGTPGADIDAICALSGVQLDCNGEIFGTAIQDDCGVCNEPTSPEYNQSCLDCAGTVNGTATIDLCGDCLEPNDPLYNLACAKNKDLYIPNVISQNSGTDNEFSVQSEEGAISDILTYAIYDRWGNLIDGFIDGTVPIDNMRWWRGQNYEQGVYTYLISVKYYDGEMATETGHLTLIR